jgi:hypothetical protein
VGDKLEFVVVIPVVEIDPVDETEGDIAGGVGDEALELGVGIREPGAGGTMSSSNAWLTLQS